MRLILIFGPPGSGKSTVAKAYVARYGGKHINSDLIRGELGLRGHYQPGDKERVYAAMLERAEDTLEAGETAVVDSTFYRENIRKPFELLAVRMGAPVFRVEIRATEETIRRRLQTPRPDSEADFTVYENIRDAFEPWESPFLTLWTDAVPLEDLTEAIFHYCHPART